MKTRLTFLTFLSLFLLVVLVSCNKEEDVVADQYMRGGNSVAVAADGNLIIAGYNYSSTKGYEATLVKANAETGAVIWDTTYGGSYSDAFYSVKKSHDGGFIAAGFTNRANASSPAMLAVITDGNGKVVESNTYGGSASSQAFYVLDIVGGGYLLAGYIQQSSNTDRNIYLVKIDNAGDTLWTKSLGSKSTIAYDSVNDAAYSVIAAPDGGYFVTGSYNAYSNYGGRVFLMKISSTGESLWTKKYVAGIGFSLTLTHENGVATGVAISGSLQEGSNQNIFLLKTDTVGNLLWSGSGIKSFGGSGFEYGATMIETSDGGFAITGITDSKGYGNQDVFLIKTNSLGESAWEKTYGGADNDQGFGLVEMPDKGFSMAGLSNTGGSFIFVNRVKEDGTQFWTKPGYFN